MALASGLPLAGVSSTLAVAAAVPEAERAGRTVLAVIESRRDEPWVQAFDSELRPLSEAMALAPERAALLLPGPVVMAGDAAERLLPFLPGAVTASSPGWPDARVVADLAAAQWPLGRSLPPEPLYLRPPDVTMA